jgi:4-amino-4-deoxy-L-arabinose transferase-like glycosyltransferase
MRASTHASPVSMGGHREAAIVRRLEGWHVAGSIIVLAGVFFLLAGGAGLSDPGLEYDEMLFVNGALGATHPYHGFIYSEFLGVPTMLMPYIGALKAWLYAPIFSLFGVSVDSVRIPALLLALVAVLLATRLIYRLFGIWPAVMLVVLLATDPGYGALARTDWGPIVLSSLLRVIALLCYFTFLRRRAVRYLWLLVAALLLGLFNKLDFAWFIAAFGVAALVVQHRELFDVLRRRRYAVLTPIAVLAGVGIAAFFVLILPADRLPKSLPHLSLGGRISEVVSLFLGTFDGASVYENMTASRFIHPTFIGSLFPWVLVFCLALAAWYLIWGRHLSQDDGFREVASTTTFFLILFVVLAVGIVLTRQATGPWHVMLLWPLPAVLSICLLVTAMRLPNVQLRRVAVVGVSVALTVLLATQIRATKTYVDAYRHNRRWSSPWSTEIYAAARSVSRSAPGVESIITADWGLGTEIFALGNEAVRDRFADAWASFTSPTATSEELERELFRGRRVIVIYHAQAAQVMPLTTTRVQAILKAAGPHAHPIFVGRQIEAEEVVP